MPPHESREEREARLLALCQRRGLTVHYLRPGAPMVRVVGPGVDVLARRLTYIAPHELKPVHWRR